MSSTLSAQEISNDAAWLAQALDVRRGVTRLVAMDRDSYRAANFLDDRLLKQPVEERIVAWRDVADVMRGDFRTDARWIFHIGHAGSTLVSRLLGEIEGVLALREPSTLRALCRLSPETRQDYVPTVTKLMSRTFSPGEIACVKATSFVSEIAPELVPPGERALFLYVNPRDYIATVLRGRKSVAELHDKAPSRAKRLAGRVPRLEKRAPDEAQLAAMAWATEMTSLEAAAQQIGDRKVAWADFDALLSDMPGGLSRLAGHFGFDATAERISSIASGPLLTRYSKSLAHPFSAETRRQTIGEVAGRRANEIEGAMRLLHDAAAESPILAQALTRAEGG